jgi:translation initiation factor IF-1
MLSQPVPNKVDLSIFKKARTDVVYQGEVREETGKKLMRTAAANQNERVGFLSGKLRQLKF